eukprot:scaffold795_cov187-Amphora_coffeaeformis.AAC.7
MKNRRYCLMGQVCVAQEYRGRGVMEGLYQGLRRILSHHFDFIVTAISSGNPRSLRAHAKVGFQTLCEDDKGWKIVIWDWKTP